VRIPPSVAARSRTRCGTGLRKSVSISAEAARPRCAAGRRVPSLGISICKPARDLPLTSNALRRSPRARGDESMGPKWSLQRACAPISAS
jgi:hypothetical protein